MARAQFAASRVGIAVCAITAAFACGKAQGGVRDLDGEVVDPFARARGVTVLAFTSTECPISSRYAPELRRLHAAFAQRARFFLVYPSRRDRVAKVRAHVADFAYDMPALLDPDHVLVARARAEVTPEVAVFRDDGSLAYAGRIDDRYVAFGKARPEPTRRDLELALEAVLAGRPVEPARTKAIGCAISD